MRWSRITSLVIGRVTVEWIRAWAINLIAWLFVGVYRISRWPYDVYLSWTLNRLTSLRFETEIEQSRYSLCSSGIQIMMHFKGSAGNVVQQSLDWVGHMLNVSRSVIGLRRCMLRAHLLFYLWSPYQCFAVTNHRNRIRRKLQPIFIPFQPPRLSRIRIIIGCVIISIAATIVRSKGMIQFVPLTTKRTQTRKFYQDIYCIFVQYALCSNWPFRNINENTLLLKL